MSDDWFIGGNWQGSNVPTSGTVYIRLGDSVIASGSATSGAVRIADQNGNLASLAIEQGGSLTASSTTIVGSNGGQGSLSLQGGLLTTRGVEVGTGTGGGKGTLTITDGGVLTSTNTSSSATEYIGRQSAGSAGTVTISGQGSLWRTFGEVNVGQQGEGSLIVENGGRLVAGGVYNPVTQTYIGNGLVGLTAGDTTTARGRIVIDGPGSTISTEVSVNIGGQGEGTLIITNGGKLENGTSGPSTFAFWGAALAYNPGSKAEVLVDGADSAWTSSAMLLVGAFGQASMTISNGGHVSSDDMAVVAWMNDPAGPARGTVLVTGAGSLWKASALDMALTAGTQAVVTLADGGTLQLTTADGVRVANLGDGEINIGAPVGQAPAAPGVVLSPAILLVQPGSSRLNLNHSDDSGSYVLDTAFYGNGDISVLAGTTTFPADSPQFAGTVSVSGGRLIVNGLFGGAYGGVPASNFAIGANGTLGGSGTLVGDVTNAGTIAPGALNPAGSYSTLTIRGDYVSRGGSLVLNTFLAADGSPSDKLAIDGGSASGTTSVFIRDAGGLGAQTTGDGILVIEAINGATTAGATFTPGARIAAGLYEYSLHRGSSQTDNWYLSSNYVAPPTPTPTPAHALPNYRVEVPVYTAAPALANHLGLAMLGTYHDRIGERYARLFEPVYETRTIIGKDGRKYDVRVPLAQPGDDRSRFFAGAWARLFGESRSVGYSGKDLLGRLAKFEKNGPSYDYTLAGIQAGFDLYRADHGNGGGSVAGLYAGTGRIDADVRAVYGGKAGSMAMDAYSFGAYATRMGASGWYVDGVMQATLFRDVKGTSVLGERLRSDGWGGAASLEGGYPIALGSGFALEPQMQVIYQHISLDNGADRFGQVRYGDTDTIYGRLGARLTRDWELAGERSLTTWVRTNLWHMIGADAKTSFSNVYNLHPGTMRTSLGGTWAQFGAGVSGLVAPDIALFATGDYNVAVGTGRGHGFGGRLGVRVAW